MSASQGFCTREDEDCLLLLLFQFTDSSGQFRTAKFYLALLGKTESLLLQWPLVSSYSFSINEC